MKLIKKQPVVFYLWIFLIIFLAQGCGGPNKLYIKDGGTPAAFEADKQDCMYVMGYAGTNQKYLTFGDLANVREDIHHCLTYRKGWRVATPEEVPQN